MCQVLTTVRAGLTTLCLLFHLILTTTLCHSIITSIFQVKNLRPEKLRSLLKATKAVDDRVGI